MTNILKESIENLKKRNTSLNKVHSSYLSKLSICNKYYIVFYITRNYKSLSLSVILIIQGLQLDTSTTKLKYTLKDLGYNY